MRRTSLLLDDGGRRWALLAGGACLLPLLLQLPPTAALAIGLIAAFVSAVAFRRTVPAWLRALLALTLLGLVFFQGGFAFGRDTGCALLAAMLAIKPSELRTLRDARSLLGFALFAPFATFLLDQGPLSLGLGLLGALLALAAMSRLAEQEAGLPPARGDTARRLWDIGRLTAIGLPLTLAAFWLFPRIGTPLWGVPELSASRPGLSEEMSPGQWLDLMADDTPALRATFRGPEPDPREMYWRGPTLTDYDGRSWTASDWLRYLPPAEITHGAPTWDYEIALEPTERNLLVALEMPTSLPDGMRASHEHTLTSPRRLDRVTRWQLQSAPPTRFEADLPQSFRAQALRLPEGFNPRTRALALSWRAETDDDAALVDRALGWIREEFAYTLDTPLPGRNAVDEFLFDYQAGFCEHFSSAFVVLMREAGIPARVVTGYVGGYRNSYGNYWVVRRMDAHAWAEVWLAGRGWVRIDPTAAVAPERIYDTIDDRLGAGGAAGSALSPILDLGDWARRGWNDLVLGFDANRQQLLLQRVGVERLDAPMLIALFSACAALALGWMLWLVARGERERDPLLRAWHALTRRYAREGLARRRDETASDWLARVVTARPGRTAALEHLTRRFIAARYAAGAGAAPIDPRLLRDLRAHRPAPLETAR
ncbi:transglutaminase TgpA family protein [Luteimonas rhizosphaerae]